MAQLFGTDGIRGLANTPPMDSETVLRLGRAAACVFRRSKGRHRIIIGKDTRVSGYMLETALASGLSSMGVDVLLAGPLPTPGVAFITRSMRADAGIMISASHNSYEDNGIKFFGPDGFKLADSTEMEIERLMKPGSLDELRADPALIGKAYRIDDAVGRYIVFLKACVEQDCDFEGLKIVVDSAHGAAYKVAPLVFSELGAKVITIGDKPNGMNINEGCGSTYPEAICKAVVESGADCGIAYDGDADRVILCDEKGEIIDGDDVLALLATDAVKSGKLKGDGVVGTVMSNLGLEKYLEEQRVRLVRAAVGDRHVLAEMIRSGMNIGGEQSGHIIALDHNTTGDGLLTSLLVLSAAVKLNKPLSIFRNIFKKFPQILINIKVKEKKPIESIPEVTNAITSVENELGNKGRVIVRYSGTELKARVMVEAESSEQCEKLAGKIANAF